MDKEKNAVASHGTTHFESMDSAHLHVAELEASGLKKTEEKEITAHNADYAAAIGENKPNPWARGYLHLYCYCFVIYLCSTMNGYVESEFYIWKYRARAVADIMIQV